MKIHCVLIALAVTGLVLSADAQNSTTPPSAAVKSAPAVNPDEVVARVGNVTIKRRELDISVNGFLMQLQRQGRMVPPEMRGRLEYDVLDELVGRELVLEVNRAHPPAGVDQKVKEELDRARLMAGGEEALTKALQEAGVARNEFEQRTRDNMIVMESLRQLVDQKSVVATNEIKSFYDSNVTRFKQPELVRASHILIRVPADATEESKKLKRTQIEAARSLVVNGEKFADIARKVSEDPGSATKGGDLDYFPRGAMMPEFEKVAFELSTNKVSEVFTTDFGYHVLLVADHKPAKQLGFDEVKADIERFLRARKGGEITQEYVKELRGKAKVDILLPPLPALPATPVNAPAK